MPTYQRSNERLGAEGGVAAGRMQSLGVNFGSVDWARGHASFFSEWTPTARLSPWQPLAVGAAVALAAVAVALAVGAAVGVTVGLASLAVRWLSPRQQRSVFVFCAL